MTAITTKVNGSTRRKVLTFVHSNAGATSEDMAAALNSTPTVTSTAAKALCDQGVLARQRVGRPFRYFVPERAPTATDAVEQTTGKQTTESVGERADLDRQIIESLRVDVAEMEAEIDALEAWKADAIARYPDLGLVDPLLVKAREIAARGGWMVGSFGADVNIANGEFDSHPIVQAIYATLQEA